MADLMNEDEWGPCVVCGKPSMALIPVLYGTEEVDEPVCEDHIWGADLPGEVLRLGDDLPPGLFI
jgi:hypothetical protein